MVSRLTVHVWESVASLHAKVLAGMRICLVNSPDMTVEVGYLMHCNLAKVPHRYNHSPQLTDTSCPYITSIAAYELCL